MKSESQPYTLFFNDSFVDQFECISCTSRWDDLPFFPARELSDTELKLIDSSEHIFSTDLEPEFGSYYLKDNNKIYSQLERKITVRDGTLFPKSKREELKISQTIEEINGETLKTLQKWREWFIKRNSAWYAPLDRRVHDLIFYSWKKAALPEGDDVPLLAIGLLKKPTSRYKRWWPRSRRKYNGCEKKIKKLTKKLQRLNCLQKTLKNSPLKFFMTH